MRVEHDERAIRDRVKTLSPYLDERGRRLMLGAEAKAAGRGGVSAVVRATGASFRTVSRAVAELSGTEPLAEGRIRKAGGGRKPIEELHPEVLDALDYLLEPLTRGDPRTPDIPPPLS